MIDDEGITNKNPTSPPDFANVMGRIIDGAKSDLLMTYDYRLAGLIRDTWANWFLRGRWKHCLRAARYTLLYLPQGKPEQFETRYGFDHFWSPGITATWLNEATEAITRFNDRSSDPKNKSWPREKALCHTAIWTLNESNWQLSIQMLYEEPKYMDALRRNMRSLVRCDDT